jgi:hypothetical protein
MWCRSIFFAVGFNQQMQCQDAKVNTINMQCFARLVDGMVVVVPESIYIENLVNMIV